MIFNEDERETTLFGKTTLQKFHQLNILIISDHSLLMDEVINNILNIHPNSITVFTN